MSSRLTRRRTEPARGLADSAVEDFHAALSEVPSRSAPLAALALHSLTAKMLGAAVLAASMAAAGTKLDLQLAVIVYALALVAATASFLPGGMGTVEASMGALLVAHGVAPPNALAIVVTFRFFDLWLPVILGLMAVRRVRQQPIRPWREPSAPPDPHRAVVRPTCCAPTRGPLGCVEVPPPFAEVAP